MDKVANVIDISHHNTINDFAALKAQGVLGVIHKATQGAFYADPMYAQRRKLATDAGLLWGAYAFNTGQDPKVQVGNFLAHADPDENTLVALDFEDNPGSQMSLSQAVDWINCCADQLGRMPVFYSGNRIKDLLGLHVDADFGKCRLWLAQYGPTPVVQATWQKPWLWQYSERGQFSGTDGYIDLNFYDGTIEQLTAEWAS